ncbi:MAG: imidazolonepropionase, partial [Candidatus Krumholzibacteria bacterium]|nr:imidazolonepropionase [Candidatus Krumholzibacteria bacterium]
MPEHIDLLLHGAGQLVTCRGSLGEPKRGVSLSDPCLVRDGAIAIVKGRIFAAGTEDEVERKAAGASIADVIDAGGRVVMPGWVDPHTHAVFSRYRADE